MTAYDPKALQDLLARVEGATGADREIDGLIAQAVGEMPADFRWNTNDAWGEPLDHWVLFTGNGYEFRDAEPITASIDAALALVERLLPGKPLFLAVEPFFAKHPALNEKPCACDISNGTSRPWSSTGNTLPLAILAALLKALIANAPQA